MVKSREDDAMDKEAFLNTFRESLRAITDTRYFLNERGYQGALMAGLKSRTNIEQGFPHNAIWEQEYQKKLNEHNIRIRPDLILHIPYETGTYDNRRRGNYVVIQLKRKASKSKAREDFNKLDLMFNELDLGYPLGIFLNINSANTFFDCYKGKYREQLHCFAVRLIDGQVVINEQQIKEAHDGN